jgi:hypothetical protein
MSNQSIFGGSLPGAGSNLLTTSIAPTRSTKQGRFAYQFCPSNAGVLSVTFTVDATTRSQLLMGGSALTAGVLYPGEVLVPDGATVNFQYTGANTGTYDLEVRELLER